MPHARDIETSCLTVGASLPCPTASDPGATAHCCLVSSRDIVVLSRLAVSSCLAAPHVVVTVSLVAASSHCAVTAVLLSCLAVVIVSISFLDIFLLELLVVSCSACLSLCCLLLPLGLLSLLDLPLLTPLLCCFPSCVPRPYLFACLLELYLTVDGLLRMLLQFVAVHQACQGCPVDRHANSILLRTRLISWLSRTLFRIIQQCYLFFSPQPFDHCLACSQLSRCFSTPPSLYRIKQSISSPLLRLYLRT